MLTERKSVHGERERGNDLTFPIGMAEYKHSCVLIISFTFHRLTTDGCLYAK